MQQLINYSRQPFVIIGVILSLLLSLAPFFLAELSNSFGGLSSHHLFYINRAFFMGVLGLMFVYSVKVEKHKLLLWREKKYSLIFYLKSIATILSLSVIIVLVLGALLIALRFDPDSKKLSDVIRILSNNKILILPFSLLAGLVEELLFRGYLIPRLEYVLKKKYAASVTSSILFGLSHISYGTLQQVIVPTFIGLLYALYYQKYRNIKVLIICHFVWDASIFYLLACR